MGQDRDDGSGNIDGLDELRETTRILAAWRAGALVRINRKQTERAVRRAVRRVSSEHPAISIPPKTER